MYIYITNTYVSIDIIHTHTFLLCKRPVLKKEIWYLGIQAFPRQNEAQKRKEALAFEGSAGRRAGSYRDQKSSGRASEMSREVVPSHMDQGLPMAAGAAV